VDGETTGSTIDIYPQLEASEAVKPSFVTEESVRKRIKTEVPKDEMVMGASGPAGGNLSVNKSDVVAPHTPQ
jgi:hypothetical protein